MEQVSITNDDHLIEFLEKGEKKRDNDLLLLYRSINFFDNEDIGAQSEKESEIEPDEFEGWEL